MSYQVIARKWRPQSFSELKGQESTRRTLINAIKNGRLHHALLFTGPRGTGKTSTARIVAKILRCENLNSDSTPCNSCTSCVEISEGRSLDVLEIDGASNNGVDSVRELREQVNFNPTSGKNKIYIVDEVHMLSGSAFNALLKTLEEPPENVYFIMATTEVHKLPKTILSRCQKYDFKPVPQKQILELLKTILKEEGFTYEEEALYLIAQAGEGCVRDSLSFLDQCITFSDGQINTKDVIENLGVSDISQYKKILESLVTQEAKELLQELKGLKEKNVDPQIFLEDLVMHLKNLILFYVDGEYLKNDENYSEVEKDLYIEISKKTNLETLYGLFDICFKGTLNLTKSFNPLILLEVTLMKAVTLSTLTATTDKETGAETTREDQPLKQEQVISPTKPNPKAQRNKGKNSWQAFVAKVTNLNPVVGSKLELCKYHYDRELKELRLFAEEKSKFMTDQLKDENFLLAVKNYIKSFWGDSISVIYGEQETEVEAKPSIKKEQESLQDQKLDQMKEKIENLDVIKNMKNKYNVRIKEIKETKGEMS